MDRAACHGSEHPPPPPDRPLAARGSGRKPWHILGENGWRILTENLHSTSANAAGGSPRRARGAISARSEDGGGIGDHHAGPPTAPAFPRRVSGCPRCPIGRA